MHSLKKTLKFFVFLIFIFQLGFGQDTIVVQTFTYDSTGRNYMFDFPPMGGQSYRKILMQYSMRCKGGLVSTGTQTNLGCGEWDYSCNTYLTDSSQTDSIKASHPSHVISSNSQDTFNFSLTPTFSYQQYAQQQLTINSTVSENAFSLGGVNQDLDHPFGASKPNRRTQYLFKASELSSSGMLAGDISRLALDVSTGSETMSFLRIRIKHTTQTELNTSNAELSDLQEVYFLNTPISMAGPLFLDFYAPFTWDGSSNLLLDLSYTNAESGTDVWVKGDETGFSAAMSSSVTDHHVKFNGTGGISAPTTGLGSISDQITVSFWCYGSPEDLPANTYIFEGTDESNLRQVNVHLPWSNSRMYWDCGNDGSGYDRIDKDATVEEIEGKWNHWAFTKNTNTGEMKIILNGTLWHSGTGLTRPINIQNLNIGSSINQTGGYKGAMDEFRIWDKELDESTIQNWMYKNIDGSHPFYGNLVAYYPFDEGQGFTTSDASPSAVSGEISIGPVWATLRGKDRFRNFEPSTSRPKFDFIQGEYLTTLDTLLILDSLPNSLHSIESFEVEGNNLIPIDTQFVWPGGNMPITDEAGNFVGSIAGSSDGVINIYTLDYYSKSASKIELMSFVTPYGINLDMGPNGKMWEFDMSDYVTVLHGKKRLSIERGGQNQEEMDIKFLFITGTPERDVHSLQQIWPVTSQSYASLNADDRFEPRQLKLNPTSSSYKIRSAITGHGQQGEFISRYHKLNVNGGSEEFGWNVWKECAENPVYPQGGTWVFDRTGWCPGAATDVQNSVLDEYVEPGETITLDYSVGPFGNPGDTRYIVNHQLVSYGNPTFTQDAAIEEVMRPSKRIEYAKFNPGCSEPIVVIKNTGATPLTSLDISYSVPGGPVEVFEWTGNLNFTEKAEVTLPVTSMDFWEGSGETTFRVDISNPNGGIDENTENNTYLSPFTLPDMYERTLILRTRTNEVANQNSYRVYDAAGNIVLQRLFMSDETTYEDYITFKEGCYTLDFRDTGDDGLDFWYWDAVGQGVGTGSLRLRDSVTNSTWVNFNPDFGDGIQYDFSFQKPQDTVGIENGPGYRLLSIYPNPSHGIFTLEMHGYNDRNEHITVTNALGMEIYRSEITKGGDVVQFTEIDLSAQPTGIYFISIGEGKSKMTRKVVRQ